MIGVYMKKFIVIDGLDGCGKDTQVNLLVDAYENRGRDVTVRSHPCCDNKFGRKSKQALLKKGKVNKIKATLYFGLDALRSVQMYYYNKDTDVLIFSRYTMAVAYLPNTSLAMKNIRWKKAPPFLPLPIPSFCLPCLTSALT